MKGKLLNDQREVRLFTELNDELSLSVCLPACVPVCLSISLHEKKRSSQAYWTGPVGMNGSVSVLSKQLNCTETEEETAGFAAPPPLLIRTQSHHSATVCDYHKISHVSSCCLSFLFWTCCFVSISCKHLFKIKAGLLKSSLIHICLFFQFSPDLGIN